MPDDLRMLQCSRKIGLERATGDDGKVTFALPDFWQWAYSDLVSNARRGILAEFIVASALGLGRKDVRIEWGTVDLVTSKGLKIEVKSAAYVQSWRQQRLSTISFDVAPHRRYNHETGEAEGTATRRADVYVFALLGHQDKVSIDPLDLRQWQFYVLPTSTLDSRERSQHSITLKSLITLRPQAVTFTQLRQAVKRAAAEQASTHKS